jgi:transcription elongation factor GreA
MKETKQYLTKEKFDELTKELEELKTVKRKEVAESLEYAKSLGDLSENAEYQEARELQANIEERIVKLESIIKLAVLVELHHSEVVDVGTKVTLQKESIKEPVKYEIVGSEEADTLKGKISYLSPLGQALMGKKKGDKFVLTTPKGEVKYAILAIA